MHHHNEQSLMIFTDGSSLGNPGPGGYGAVIVFSDLDEVVELGGGKPQTTNNEMELSAAVAALSYCSNNTLPIYLYTDSTYVVKGIMHWIHGWEQNGWQTKDKKPVSHKRLWQSLHEIVKQRPDSAPVHWNTVPGHVGVPGNERADAIAQGFARGNDLDLYRGRLSLYNVKDILDVSINDTATSERNTARTHRNAKAHSYLSMIDGVVVRHGTWAETEARVKGKNAKFRKAVSADHEKEILADWGKSIDDVSS